MFQVSSAVSVVLSAQNIHHATLERLGPPAEWILSSDRV